MRDHLIWIVLLTLLMEVAACIARFGLGLESSHDTQFIAAATFGLRIHHGYIGMALALYGMRITSQWASLFIRVGWAMVLSDIVHHFLVLWPITGSPDFDIFYPALGG